MCDENNNNFDIKEYNMYEVDVPDAIQIDDVIGKYIDKCANCKHCVQQTVYPVGIGYYCHPIEKEKPIKLVGSWEDPHGFLELKSEHKSKICPGHVPGKNGELFTSSMYSSKEIKRH